MFKYRRLLIFLSLQVPSIALLFVYTGRPPFDLLITKQKGAISIQDGGKRLSKNPLISE